MVAQDDNADWSCAIVCQGGAGATGGVVGEASGANEIECHKNLLAVVWGPPPSGLPPGYTDNSLQPQSVAKANSFGCFDTFSGEDLNPLGLRISIPALSPMAEDDPVAGNAAGPWFRPKAKAALGELLKTLGLMAFKNAIGLPDGSLPQELDNEFDNQVINTLTLVATTLYLFDWDKAKFTVNNPAIGDGSVKWDKGEGQAMVIKRNQAYKKKATNIKPK